MAQARCKCPRCAEERILRAEAEGAAAGDAWAIQKAERRLARVAQELSAVATMLAARREIRADRTSTELRLASKAA